MQCPGATSTSNYDWDSLGGLSNGLLVPSRRSAGSLLIVEVQVPVVR